MSVAYNISKNVKNTTSTNVISTVSKNSDDKKARYKMNCYTLFTFLLVFILLFATAIIRYHYAKHWSKQKNIGSLTI